MVKITKHAFISTKFTNARGEIIAPYPRIMNIGKGYSLIFIEDYELLNKIKPGSKATPKFNYNNIIGWRVILLDRVGCFKLNIMNQLFPELGDLYGTITCRTEDELDYVVDRTEQYIKQ